MQLRIIITGVTGMVGEGVLFECLANPSVSEILVVGRKHYNFSHDKLKELIIPDFLQLAEVEEMLTGYDACFYCSGVSAAGMKEAEYSRITYDTTLHFARTLVRLNKKMVFDYVSGKGTDSTEQGRMMWARVKGKTENELMKLPFKRVYNFRPGLIKPTTGQKNIKSFYKFLNGLYPVLQAIFPNSASTLKEVGLAMINSMTLGYDKSILEVRDIKLLAKKQ